MTVKDLLKAMTGKQAKTRGSSASAAAPAGAGGGPAGAASGGCAFSGCVRRPVLALQARVHRLVGHPARPPLGASVGRDHCARQLQRRGGDDRRSSMMGYYKLEGALPTQTKRRSGTELRASTNLRRRKLFLGNQVLHSLALASDKLFAPLRGQAKDAHLLSYPRRGIAVLSERSQPLDTAKPAATTHARLKAGAPAAIVVAPVRPNPLRCAAARPGAAWKRPKIRRGSGIGGFRRVQGIKRLRGPAAMHRTLTHTTAKVVSVPQGAKRRAVAPAPLAAREGRRRRRRRTRHAAAHAPDGRTPPKTARSCF
jgi:hypothetical protein